MLDLRLRQTTLQRHLRSFIAGSRGLLIRDGDPAAIHIMKSSEYPLVTPVAIIVFLVLGTLNANARLGESAIQCADRYGPAKTDQGTLMLDKTMPILEGAIHHAYTLQGWTLRAAFLEINGPAVRVQYQKNPAAGASPQIQDYETAAILKGETPEGMTWSQVSYNNPNSPNHGILKAFEGVFVGAAMGAKSWQRSDGAIAQLMPGGSLFRLELPAAHQYEEQLKVQKEQKARASVPQF